ncbi:peptidoglycan DD-metalloendopeptidase family protein [Curvibacter sp. APW13]|uniref:peptidoglycan DD-metalloendopeptidase family protein n=1 Tax=Curvibacter sp. APW13 TaxID=3077236 RepID=UPI0028DE57F5|nr:peptidoglycan DD-metalloendopeptidase family protein [Curvibacter sp. APW13]MDT8992158.1 peptidoglycan DD-metalloendopeptidase family protein [Curvibacter sp. APW13]
MNEKGRSVRAAIQGWAMSIVAVAVLTACGSKPVTKAPVEDRGMVTNAPAQTDPRTLAVKQPPGFENAGKPGYYTIKPGDTLIRIGLETGQSYKDIARWNSLDNPNKIEVGQVIRVVAPVEPASAVVVGKPAPAPVVVATPLPAAAPGAVAPTPVKPASAPAAVAAAPAKAASAPAPAPAAAAPVAAAPANDDDLGFVWPASGNVVAGFDESKNKGIDIGGKEGDAVVAAADGKVVYAGSSLRGYGNLIILKHNNTYLTAYAHNRALLVKEDQTVKKGQKIAEMGNSDADRVKLHFEVRKQGKPVDPAKYLPGH